MKPEIKKMLILNAPYLIFVYAFDKIAQAFRLAPGADLTGKLLSIGDGFAAAFSNALPSFDPMDLIIGIAGAAIVRLAVYLKGKNAKKYRKGIEYGSARWGNAEDIKPYIDPVFENNVLLTQTERLYYFHDMSDADIAKLYNIPRSTVQHRRTSSFSSLKKFLEERADDETEW